VQVAALIGHSKGGISLERYGKPFAPAVLAKVITQLNYDAVLEHVRPF
jgi:hypothetical protein